MNHRCPNCFKHYKQAQECDWCPGTQTEPGTCYYILCRYEPNFKHLGGRVTRKKKRGKVIGHTQARGAWRVSAVMHFVAPEAQPVCNLTNNVAVISTRPRQLGTRCSPHKILNEWIAERRKRNGIQPA